MVPSPEPLTAAAGTTRCLAEDWEALTFRVHRSAYRSPELYAREQAALWGRSWLYLGHVSEVPNPRDFKVRSLGGRPLILCRDADGQIRVYFNSCPHRGTILCREREGNSKYFQCFYHAWTFDTSGALVSLPDAAAYPADGAFREALRLRRPPRMAIHHGFVFVSYNPDAPELAEHLGDAGDYIAMVAEHSATGMEVLPGAQLYSVRGNWKLAVENAMDGYHFAPTHNTFIGYLRETGFATSDEGGLAKPLGRGHSVLIQSGHSGRVGLAWEPRFGDAARAQVERNRQELFGRLTADRATSIADTSRILYVFPNLLLFDIEALSIRQLEPVTPDRTEVRAWELAPRGEPADQRALRIKMLVSFVGPGGLATPDDIEAYEAVQRGILATEGVDGDVDWSDMSRGMAAERSGTPGRSIDEGALRSFWRHWSRELDAPMHVETSQP